MALNFTGLSYFFLLISLGFLSLRFFQYWRENKDITSKFFFFLSCALVSLAFVRAVSCIFFVDNSQVLRSSIVWIAFLQGLGAAIVAYLIIYLKLPKISPWFGFFLILLLGLVSTYLALKVPYQPVLESSGAIDWGGPTFKAGLGYYLLRMGILSATFLPLIAILFQQFLASQDPFVRKRSLGLSLALLLGILIGFIDFILHQIFGLTISIYRDYTTIAVAFVMFLIVFLTQKPKEFKQMNKAYGKDKSD